LLALLIARSTLSGECVAQETVRRPDRQVGIEQAVTDRLYEIHWVDVAYGRFLRAF
jgi:hypothetical protein